MIHDRLFRGDTMIKAFLFLLSRSFVNRTHARLKRLKQPKYLVGGIFGLLYLFAYSSQFLFLRGRPGGPIRGAGTMFESIGAIVIFVLVLSAWIFPHQRAALVFTEAEIAFLFPAPVTRRALIHFKLLKSQVAILFTVLLLTLLTGRLFSSAGWMRVLGWWIILATLNLHFLGASFARTLLLERGFSNWLRRGLVVLLLALLIAVSAYWARQTMAPPALADFTDWRAWRDYLDMLVTAPPLSYLLYPIRVVLHPYLANSTAEFLTALAPALAVIGAHYAWVVLSNVAFEEASLDVSRRMAEKIAAARAGRGLDVGPRKGARAPFSLGPTGLSPVAFLWKNLIGAQTAFRARTVVVLLIPLIVIAVVAGKSASRGGMFLATTTLVLFICYTWSLFIGAQLVRCDFRKDLASMDMLKLFPLRGWEIVVGELLAPLAILTVLQWILLLLLTVFAGLGGATNLPRLPVVWVVVAGILTPFWNALVLLIPNAAVLLFPGWFQTRLDAPQGIEVMGQRLLLVFGQFVVVGVALTPAAVAFGLGFVPLQIAGAGSVAPLAGSIAAALVMAGEIALGIWSVGKLYDRFDLSGD
jgi:hypothetical protein